MGVEVREGCVVVYFHFALYMTVDVNSTLRDTNAAQRKATTRVSVLVCK
jgi:hypothetical protein